MDEKSKQFIIENYRNLFLKHGSGPEASQGSAEGQRFRFEKLLQIGDLTGCRVLDLGCGLGDLYPFLLNRFDNIDYTGIDIVPELVDYAAKKYSNGNFLCRDILKTGIDGMFDYVLISGIFNNSIAKCTNFLKDIVTVVFNHCTKGIAFNFISTYVNHVDPGMAYHDPIDIIDFCLKTLTWKATMHHHYERCDVAVFLYRE
jgi:SAM-dependent methyltransferase